ncbi:preprotein translocase subunit YajC [Ilumatobacter coccineus]|jgi:preprotein translocase subunit YajC|uniref:preprotein translocase subunit YajC n=1 Tax=Ilumatobacter coccineus TaxID=467094 RepID=UPI00087080F9|nr:preprotein translocase subunit YajC [Ilumatobacter coccineus]
MTTLFANAVLGSAESSGGASSIFSLGLLLLVPFGMYFFMIRPQRRKMREQQELQAALGVGDEVVTTSGIFGTITGEDGDSRFWLEIDDDVQIRIARAAIQGRVSPDDDDDETADTDADAASAEAD